jgi:diguanylate cyclase (GGDEF)-like protein/PAS domain S-box-containing protein
MAVTWVYDQASDAVSWSSPIEEFLGFTDSVRGFTVVPVGAEPSGASGPPNFAFDLGGALIDPVLELIRSADQAGPVEVHLVVTSPDGVARTLAVRATPMTGSGNDSHQYYNGEIVDVTAQQRFELALESLVDRYRLLSEGSPDAVIVHQNGCLVYGNQAAMRLIGTGTTDEDYDRSIEEYYGTSIAGFLHPDEIESTLIGLATLTEVGQSLVHNNVRMLLPDGSCVRVDLTSLLTTWDNQPAYQVIMREARDSGGEQAANNHLAGLIAHVSDAVIGVDPGGLVDSWNDAAEKIYGWDRDDILGKPAALVAGVSPDHEDTLSGWVTESGQTAHSRKDGSLFEVLVSVEERVGEAGAGEGRYTICTELTDPAEIAIARRAGEERFEAVVGSLHEGIVMFNAQGLVSGCNHAATQILGARLEIGRDYKIFCGDSFTISHDGKLITAADFPHCVTQATRLPLNNVVVGVTSHVGAQQWLSLSSRYIDGNGSDHPAMVVCSFTDTTESRQNEAKLRWGAHHDTLTGLGNRVLFCEELALALVDARQMGSNLAVLFVDLDRFKMINDSLGHAAGDETLIALANRFKSLAGPKDIVCRFSGDEFAVLCVGVADLDTAVGMASACQQASNAPIELSSGRHTTLSSSVGVAYVPGGEVLGGEDQDVIQQADAAMYLAKEQGRGRVSVFDVELLASTTLTQVTYDELAQAVVNNELVLHYQPISQIKHTSPDGTGPMIVAHEALVRWNHPIRGQLGPLDFIPLAENSNLIYSIGRWVLRQACFDMAVWRKTVPAAASAYVAVNLSVQQLFDSELLESIRAALADSGLTPDGLVIEVTESMLMSDVSTATALLAQINDMGVGLAIDDFGTGYSSLAQLKRFPVKVLKIDKSFVDGLGVHASDEAIIATVVQLGEAFNMTVLAEGIETLEQLDRAAELGCSLYQGYLLSRPVPAREVDFVAGVLCTTTG